LFSLRKPILKVFQWLHLERLEKNPDVYSMHSFMRGCASWAFTAEVPSKLIQLYGDWLSDVYLSKNLCKLEI
jgi:hypothetical protein